ncbi:hypothetical protein NOR_08010 [Metarhizium rileyi]|uniref:MARVEL domain-containing protein n=1 Tax=Metarhizium rileyi (strain RCEF 4871) TaxID=1649241 RepID=A0A166X4R7_METRR|nr:hypothetical protein NOR_08010 [Metarhizium rileyi RCEF 4871]TWU74210.1 hypothetical protein ED733_002896 [Metarhizium rileyi]
MGFFATSVGYFAFLALHVVCFALSLAVCGLYGQDINDPADHINYTRSKWVYAVVVGALSAVTCVVWFIPALLRHAGVIGAIWNVLLFVLWITLFGVFGALFIHKDPKGRSNVQRMKSAVWVDLTGALLWLISAIATTIYWWRHREVRSTFTGRARA